MQAQRARFAVPLLTGTVDFLQARLTNDKPETESRKCPMENRGRPVRDDRFVISGFPFSSIDSPVKRGSLRRFPEVRPTDPAGTSPASRPRRGRTGRGSRRQRSAGPSGRPSRTTRSRARRLGLASPRRIRHCPRDQVRSAALTCSTFTTLTVSTSGTLSKLAGARKRCPPPHFPMQSSR